MSSVGISAVTQGMAAAEKITGKIGTDLSNSNTPGYKSFNNVLLSETSKYNGGVNTVTTLRTDVQGEISETKREFDYAIEGNGFFAVKCNGEIRYTRSGIFDLDKEGKVVHANGCSLLGKVYTDDNQQQIQNIGSSDLEEIKIDKMPIKGKATTKADISLSLSANQIAEVAIGGTPPYDLTDQKENMADGKVTPDAKSEFTVIDSLGNEHSVFVAFKKISKMEYAVEVYADKNDVKPVGSPTRGDGLIAAGIINFDGVGKGTIKNHNSVTTDVKNLEEELTFTWSDGGKGKAVAAPSKIKINWEKLQMYGDHRNINITSDGKKDGDFQRTSIDKKGNLTAHYSNGEDKLIAAIPVVTFADPNALQNEFGTVFSSTADSGKPNFKLSGQSGAGNIVSGNLEGSNVDQTNSMVDLMKQQRFNAFNSKAFGIMNSMDDQILGVIRA